MKRQSTALRIRKFLAKPEVQSNMNYNSVFHIDDFNLKKIPFSFFANTFYFVFKIL